VLRSVHNDVHLRWLDLVAQVIRRGQEQGVFADTDPGRFALGFLLDYASHHSRGSQRFPKPHNGSSAV
jgi:hypothetical protein